MTQASLIEKILKITGNKDTKYFDSLHDKTEEYLGKLLKIVKKLK